MLILIFISYCFVLAALLGVIDSLEKNRRNSLKKRRKNRLLFEALEIFGRN